MLLLFAFVARPGSALAQSDEELRSAAQNPVANMISLPFQNNVYFGIGEDDDVANVLNIQPVIPISIGDWNLITRTIIPVIHLPDLTISVPELPSAIAVGDETGLGDVNLTLFMSPAKPMHTIWGFGPSISMPTATDDVLGSEKWSAGPSAVSLVIDGPWVFGVLVRNLWSFAGDGDRRDVSQFLAQPFLTYNMRDGWYLTSAPIITANWNSGDGDNRWTVPLGGGVGRLMRFGKLPVNLQMQGFYQVERPDGGADWIWRTQIQFLFPRGTGAQRPAE
jgi:hypothetical protein